MNCIAILHSGGADRPDEQDTVQQAREIATLLESCGFAVTLVPIAAEVDGFTLLGRLQQIQPDSAINLVESYAGSDSQVYQITALLDCLKIPYTGAKTAGLLLTADKLAVKSRLKTANIATPAWYANDADSSGPIDNTAAYIVKSVTEHGSLGIEPQSVIDHPDKLMQKLQDCLSTYGGDWFAEQYIDGREFNVSLLQMNQTIQVLPIAEMRFLDSVQSEPCVIGYRAKWDESSVIYQNIVRHYQHDSADNELLQQMTDTSLRCWRLFQLRGYARIDFRVDENRQPWVIDINANPCLTADAGFMAAAAQQSLSPAAVLQHILQAV